MTRLRSVLFCPADRPERVVKALREGKADCVVADLEDAVAPERKAEARQLAAQALREVPVGAVAALRAVRVNGWGTGLAQADLEAVVPARPDLVALAKAESPHQVREADTLMGQVERRSGIPVGSTRLLLHVETAAGVLSARELAAASTRVLALAFGAEDLAADAGLRRSASNAEVSVPRALVALAAATAKVGCLDMITADPRDAERAGREAAEARSLGYTGKMCIHPAQVAAVHAAFRPTEAELAWARKVVAAVDGSGIGAGGVVVVDGRMVDVPFIEQARRILAEAAPAKASAT